MIEFESINHPIQRTIIQTLTHQEIARFRDLRPPRTDTNLFSYHLTSLIKAEYIRKVDGGYTLTRRGLAYVDRVDIQKDNVRLQPKVIVMLLVQNSDGDILLQKRIKQPYINTWTLPYDKLQIEERTAGEAAFHAAYEKLKFIPEKVNHIGMCYIRVDSSEQIISSTLAHIFRFTSDEIVTSETLAWVPLHKLDHYTLAPAVEAIIARSFFGDQFFFEEFEESE